MKHRLSLVLCALAAVSVAGDTLTFTGIRLTTYIGNESNVTVYETNEPAGNGWTKSVVNNWADVNLANELTRRRNQPGNTTDTRWGEGRAYLKVTTTRTPSVPFRLSFLRQRTATAVSTVDVTGATGGALGRLQDVDSQWETQPPASQIGPGTSDRTRVAPQDKIFHRYGGTWSPVSGGHEINLWVPTAATRGESSVGVPGGSGSNSVAVTSTSGGRYRLKPSTLSFGGSSESSRWVTGTFNAYGSNTGISIEVRNMNNVLLDMAASYSEVGNDFGFDFNQLMILFPSTQPATFKVMFKKRGALNRQALLTVDPNVGLSGVQVELLYGDVDGDNEVKAEEVAWILNHFGAEYPQAAFMSLIPGTTVSVADLDIDGDNKITLNDYLISLPNIGQVGD